MNKGKLLELAGQLMLAGVTHQDEEIEKISEQLAAELRQTEKERGGAVSAPPPNDNDLRGFLKFDAKEISKMPKSFRHTFIAEGKVICYRKRIRGKVSCSYEARYRRHGFNISVSANDLIKLKRCTPRKAELSCRRYQPRSTSSQRIILKTFVSVRLNRLLTKTILIATTTT